MSNIMEKPKNIYVEDYEDDVTTSTTSTTRKFNYEKPDGWDGKKTKKHKPSIWKILKAGLTNDESLEPKYIVKYDNWMHELKVMSITVLITLILTYSVFSSSFITTSTISEEKNDDVGLLNRGIDYLIEKYEEMRGRKVVPITSDTVHVYKDTLIDVATDDELVDQLDSIINQYRKDSIRIADSLNALE